MLVREGLAKVDEYSNAKELWAAQEAAQKERKNVRTPRTSRVLPACSERPFWWRAKGCESCCTRRRADGAHHPAALVQL